jgi:hypothetical protein
VALARVYCLIGFAKIAEVKVIVVTITMVSGGIVCLSEAGGGASLVRRRGARPDGCDWDQRN